MNAKDWRPRDWHPEELEIINNGGDLPLTRELVEWIKRSCEAYHTSIDPRMGARLCDLILKTADIPDTFEEWRRLNEVEK